MRLYTDEDCVHGTQHGIWIDETERYGVREVDKIERQKGRYVYKHRPRVFVAER